MSKNIFKTLVTALLCLVGLTACKEEPAPICGGVTDNTNPDAPKVIESKEITDFYAFFWLDAHLSAEEKHIFEFTASQNGEIVTISETNSAFSTETAKEFMASLQNVVDSHNLAENNGISKTTAGLAPKYQPCTVKITYASGETLSFKINNDPDSLWAEDFYAVFTNCFAAKGLEFPQ